MRAGHHLCPPTSLPVHTTRVPHLPGYSNFLPRASAPPLPLPLCAQHGVLPSKVQRTPPGTGPRAPMRRQPAPAANSGDRLHRRRVTPSAGAVRRRRLEWRLRPAGLRRRLAGQRANGGASSASSASSFATCGLGVVVDPTAATRCLMVQGSHTLGHLQLTVTGCVEDPALGAQVGRRNWGRVPGACTRPGAALAALGCFGAGGPRHQRHEAATTPSAACVRGARAGSCPQ